MQSAVLWLHNVHLDSTLHGGFKPLLSLCGFKPLGFREVSFILTLIYPDPRVADEIHVQPTGSTQTSRHPKGEERDLHMDNMKQTNAKGKETHIQE